jgi:pimeloyl-ACP methyl ester carboxylesterase
MVAIRSTLESVSLHGVTDARRSLLVSEGTGDRPPIVLVHGMLDSIFTWITPEEAEARGLEELGDWKAELLRFADEPRRRGAFGAMPSRFGGAGLLPALERQDHRAVAYSYQDPWERIAPLDRAVRRLQRVISFACERFQAERVRVVAYNRGGLVARHALLRNTRVMSARECVRRVDRLITIGTPFKGTAGLGGPGPVRSAFEEFGRFEGLLSSILPSFRDEHGSPGEALHDYLDAHARLTPDCSEVRMADKSRLPRLPGGYRAIAGNRPAWLECRLPLVNRVSFPPASELPAWTPGLGDLAVDVDSALDIPEPWFDSTAVVPVNHLNLPLDHRVHAVVSRWVGD